MLTVTIGLYLLSAMEQFSLSASLTAPSTSKSSCLEITLETLSTCTSVIALSNEDIKRSSKSPQRRTCLKKFGKLFSRMLSAWQDLLTTAMLVLLSSLSTNRTDTTSLRSTLECKVQKSLIFLV